LSNLQLEGSGGVSVEFWLNKQSFDSTNESRRQVVVDIWNSASWGTAGYGRFRVEISGTDGNVLNPNFNVELLSGTSGFSSDYVSAASPVITLANSKYFLISDSSSKAGLSSIISHSSPNSSPFCNTFSANTDPVSLSK